MRGLIIGGLALLFTVGAGDLARAEVPSRSGLEYRSGDRSVRLERDDRGRWRRVETVRLELEVIGLRSSRSPISIYRAPLLADLDVVRRLGQKLADREGGSVAIVWRGLETRMLMFAPRQVAALR